MHPDFIHILGHPIKWYGVLTAAGFLAAVYHWNWLARREGRDPHLGSELGVWAIVCGILGARLGYVLAHLGEYLADPLEIFRIWHGGQIYYGGLFLACIGIYLLARIRREPFLAFADFAVTGLPLGHAIGRIGCFLNGCCFGKASNLPWACMLDGRTVHPAPLYEAAANLSVYAILLAFFFRKKRDGTVLALYLLVYPPSRFLIEFLRGDPRQHWGSLTVAQGISLVMFALGIVLWFLLPNRKAEVPQHGNDTGPSGT